MDAGKSRGVPRIWQDSGPSGDREPIEVGLDGPVVAFRIRAAFSAVLRHLTCRFRSAQGAVPPVAEWRYALIIRPGVRYR
jgi:hypothetical protein